MRPARMMAGLLLGLAVGFWAGDLWLGPDAAAWASAASSAAEAANVDSATHHGSAGDSEGINPLSFKADLAIWTVVVFLLLLAVLWKFAWGPLAEALDRREQGIAQQLAQAAAANQQAKDLLAQYEQKLAAAQDEVRAILDRGRRDAEQIGRQMVEKARQEAAAEQQRALRQIETATIAALKELAERSATLAVELAGRIIQRSLRAEDHAALIERTLADFVEHKAGGNGHK